MDAQPIEKAALVPINKRIIVWDESGLPQVSAQPVLTRQNLQSLYYVAAAQPYVVDDPLDPEYGLYDGMTIAEVMVRKELLNAAKSGDKDQVEAVMDRLVGKPLARSESLNVDVNYEAYLKKIEDRVRGAAIDVTPNVFGDLA